MSADRFLRPVPPPRPRLRQDVYDVLRRSGVERVRPNGAGVPEPVQGLGLVERFAVVIVGLVIVLIFYGGLVFWARAAVDFVMGDPHATAVERTR